jgi:hypothetical protein
LHNLERGKTKGCSACSNPRRAPTWLTRRLQAAKSRCENKKDPQYPRYGGRGIEFRFDSVTGAAVWLLENVEVRKDLTLDRIDNDGHYEKGNLRFISIQDQQYNRQNTKTTQADTQWAKTRSPYSFFTTRKYLRDGKSHGEIIEIAKKAVRDKRKNWRGIQQRLKELGYMTS